MIRSMLFVPGDSEKKLAKAASVGADALVLDLEDSVLPERKPLARQMIPQYLAAQASRDHLWVRINDLTSGELLKDLCAVVPARPSGIILPKIKGPEDVVLVSNYLEALEAAAGLPAGAIRIFALVTETPAALLRLGDLVKAAPPRIGGVLWGGEDLSSAMGAGDPRAPDGAWRPTYELARSQALLTGHALGVEVIDTAFVNFKDPEGLRKSCAQARYDGFTGRVAIHPDQVEIINRAFTPSDEEIALARQIVAAFAGGAGAVSIGGKMYDIPHLKASRRLLAGAEGK